MFGYCSRDLRFEKGFVLDADEIGFNFGFGYLDHYVFLSAAIFHMINPRKLTVNYFLSCLSFSSFGSVSYFFSIFL